jgi:hypothetical protein
VLVAVEQLERLDKDQYTVEEKEEAALIAEERRRQEAQVIKTGFYPYLFTSITNAGRKSLLNCCFGP